MMRMLAFSSCVALAMLLPMGAAAQCVLSGEATIERVRIQPRGAAPFELGLEGYEAAITPLGHGVVRVASMTSLVWSGDASESDVRSWIARDVRLGGGAIVLGPGVHVAGLHLPARGDPRVDVKLDEGVWLRRAPIPCDALSLREVDVHAGGDGGPEVGEVVSRGPRLSVHGAPGGPSVAIEIAPTTELRMARIEERDGWIHVRRTMLGGARLDGWVRASDVRIVAPERFPALGGSMHGGSGCGHGASHTYVGPATLLAGAELRTAEDGAVWAVASADTDVHVFVRWGAEWGQVDMIPGLRGRGTECEELIENAWVPTGSLRLPSGQPLP